MTERPDRNLAMELVRVTEAAALAAGRWVGRGDKISADQAAVDAMRAMLDTVSMSGVVVIGEGEKDEAPMLYNGEEVGDGTGPGVDVAVDPVDGTRLTALGQPNALAVIALAERGSMFFPGAAVYMDKLVGGEEVAGAVSIDLPPDENVRRAAEAKGVRTSEIAVVVLDRERNQRIIEGLREAGAVDRVDRDVDSGSGAVADLLAVVQHGRLVLLALADHDGAVHRHRVDHQAHRVDRGAVGRDLVAVADPPSRRQGGGFGDADELQGKVAVGSWRLTRHRILRCRSSVRGHGTAPKGRISLRSAYQPSVRATVSSIG